MISAQGYSSSKEAAPFTAESAIIQAADDSPKYAIRHHKLLGLYHHELSVQAENRREMAIDADYYDGLQYTAEEVQTLRDQNQEPLVFNDIKLYCDWVLGSEKRNRSDYRVLPRTEDDVGGADIKTKLFKYLSDLNYLPYQQSRAFRDQVLVGLGWTESNVSTLFSAAEPIYCQYVSWRNMLPDSTDRTIDQSKARYQFRWQYTDLDAALTIFPNRRHSLIASAENYTGPLDEAEDLYGGSYQSGSYSYQVDKQIYHADYRGIGYAEGVSAGLRARVKIIECWYRVPLIAEVMRNPSHVLDGVVYDRSDPLHEYAVRTKQVKLMQHFMMRMRYACFTEQGLLCDVWSPYRHNRFPYTPYWGYRRDRDGMPYGMIRNMRDPQFDLNKRASKALFMLNTNQVITEHQALGDGQQGMTLQQIRQQAARPNGIIVLKDGSRLFQIRRDSEMANAQFQFWDRDRMYLQSTSGVTDELLGRPTNAVSGEAIRARQDQGSVTTMELFDNKRLAIKQQGEILLSLMEQYITEELSIRIVGDGAHWIKWITVNRPIKLSDGSLGYENDVMRSKADFVVDEQDYRQSSRQAMFDTMNQMVGQFAQVNPQLALGMLAIAWEYSDLPGKDDIVSFIRMTGNIPDPHAIEKLPKEQQAAFMQMQLNQQAAAEAEQAALKQAQAQGIGAELALKQAQAKKAQAEAQKVQTEADAKRLALLNSEDSDDMKALKARHEQQLADAEQETSRLRAQLEQMAANLDKEKLAALTKLKIEAMRHDRDQGEI